MENSLHISFTGLKKGKYEIWFNFVKYLFDISHIFLSNLTFFVIYKKILTGPNVNWTKNYDFLHVSSDGKNLFEFLLIVSVREKFNYFKYIILFKTFS